MRLLWYALYVAVIPLEADLEGLAAIRPLCPYAGPCIYYCRKSCRYDQECLEVVSEVRHVLSGESKSVVRMYLA